MGTIFAIKKYAIHDGPNIRTTIFLKGCPLACWWCHNPEGIARDISMLWLGDNCVHCEECTSICPTASLSHTTHGINRDLKSCESCGTCSDICPALAHQTTGYEATVLHVMSEIKKDLPFYDESGGGVTFSGGEPLMQPEFLIELLKQCGTINIHRAVDTCAYVQPELLLKVAEDTDLFLFDLKLMDSAKHRKYTGVANELILENIRCVAKRGKQIRIRIPLIEGVNSDDENILQSGDFIRSLSGVDGVDLLPYHGAATAKYNKLNLKYKAHDFAPMAKERITHCVGLLTEMGLRVQVGG